MCVFAFRSATFEFLYVLLFSEPPYRGVCTAVKSCKLPSLVFGMCLLTCTTSQTASATPTTTTPASSISTPYNHSSDPGVGLNLDSASSTQVCNFGCIHLHSLKLPRIQSISDDAMDVNDDDEVENERPPGRTQQVIT